MKNSKPNIPDDIKKNYDELMKIRESRRSQEEIISDLTILIKDYNKSFFLPFILEMINNIHQRDKSEAFQHLMSPMKQLIYLVDLYFSVEEGGIKEVLSKEEWVNITLLLKEIEMTYFGDIGFINEDGKEDFDKISVSLLAFIEYFGNAQLSYEEQTLERFERICGAFDQDVERLFGFSVNDVQIFSKHIRDIINNKLTECNYYFLHQDEWPKLTSRLIARGITDPKEWINEPELELFKNYLNIPGFVFIHAYDELSSVNLKKEKIERLIKFLLYDQDLKKGTTVYYADKNPFFDTPLIQIETKKFLCPPYKFLIESFYNRINMSLRTDVGEKYSQFKNHNLEKKVLEIFQKLFGSDIQIFTSYFFDKDRSEQDILIRFKKFYFIVEVKDSLFRAPMRDPLKSYDKIKSDFKKSIQYGYDQCKRVEDIIELGLAFKIYEHKTKKCLDEVIPASIKDYFSIVVTQFKYGGMQTNLENLLVKESESLYPWSVSVDDLEAFVLILKKLKKGSAPYQFIEYLRYRESYHEHLICSDELELCGYFLNDPKNFKKYSSSDSVFTTFPGMADMFDAEYQNGLGFDNELDIDIKRHYRVPNYRKDYTVDSFTGEDLSR
ncbi:MAG TPA: hypothetical protein VHO50_09545 [Bacteroidales bacterium]|nr:hypothetical protein [Bacteroidales bacterium]